MAIGGAIAHTFRRPIDRSFTLFEAEDAAAWTIFVLVFLGLLIFDNAIMFAKPRKLGFFTATCYTFFWAAVAFAFCFWLGWWQSPSSAYMWFSGYTLQWMMSFDNLFVFHLIFKVYHTPDELKHCTLFYGILGQAIFTLSLLTLGEYIFHKLYVLHFLFGLLFIYVGVTCAMGDDDDDDPTQNPIIQWLQAKLPFVSVYDTQGHFFIRLPVGDDGKVIIPACAVVDKQTASTPGGTESSGSSTCAETQSNGSSEHAVPKLTEGFYANPSMIDISKIDLEGQKTELRATMLFLVVCTMEISDVIFSVDTIVAVSMQVGDLYLAFTCVAFSLLTLRATFFIVQVLVQMFSLMKYGIGAVLVYIGFKLMIDRWYLVPHIVDLVFLVGAFGGSILASVIYDKLPDKEEEGGAAQLISEAS